MKTLSIYMGSKCNLNCPYCHREPDIAEEIDLPNLYLTIDRINPDRLKFMGGEPTLYMEAIKAIVNQYPNKQYCIATNGVTLDYDIPFFRKHNFEVILSWDGDDENKRGFNPLLQKIPYPNVAVSTTLFHDNLDFLAITKKLTRMETLTGQNLSFNPHICHNTKEHEAYHLTKEDMDKIFDQYRAALINLGETYTQFGWASVHEMGLYNRLLHRDKLNLEYGETYCVRKDLFKCDGKGRLFDCMYIRDKELTNDGWLAQQRETLDKEFPQCKTCPVYDMCGAACIKSKEHDIECYFYKKLFTWFKAFKAKYSDILKGLNV